MANRLFGDHFVLKVQRTAEGSKSELWRKWLQLQLQHRKCPEILNSINQCMSGLFKRIKSSLSPEGFSSRKNEIFLFNILWCDLVIRPSINMPLIWIWYWVSNPAVIVLTYECFSFSYNKRTIWNGWSIDCNNKSIEAFELKWNFNFLLHFTTTSVLIYLFIV